MRKKQKLMEMMEEMKKKHQDNVVDYEGLRSKIDAKKKAFLQNLEHMQNKSKEHSKVFDAVQKLTDKLPELFEDFQKFVEKLREKTEKENIKEDSEAISNKDEESEETIIQNDKTIEEEALSDVDNDEETEEQSESEDNSESNSTSEGEEKADEGQATDEMKPEEANASEVADTLESGIDDVDNHPNLTELDQEVLDKLENEQKDFEVRQKEQNDHINGLKEIDDGLVQNGNVRKAFDDRLAELLSSDEMKQAPQDVKDLLKELRNLFNARED